jgi:hypothetical protein
MKKLETLIESVKNKETKVLGPFINKIKRDSAAIVELEESTQYLDIAYNNVSIGQRFYHIWFNDHKIKKCKHCAKNARFSVYDRFSSDINKKDSNYYEHCGSVRCLIEDFKERGNGNQGYGALIAKISENIDTRNELLLLTSFLDEEYSSISNSQRFYHIFFNRMELELCEFCESPRKYGFMDKFSEIQDKRDSNYCRTCNKQECISLANIKYSKIGLMNKHGVDNIWDIPGYREGLENSNMEKYGAKYYTSTGQFREKCEEKYQLDWDGKHPTSHQSTKEKKYKTNIEKYGFKCLLSDKELMKKSMLEKYGVEHIMQLDSHKEKHSDIMKKRHGGTFFTSEGIKTKAQKTFTKNYGSIYPIQDATIFDKASSSTYKSKEYVLPSGKIINVQGYENYAIDKLLEKYNENNIITGKAEITDHIGKIKYYHNLKNRIYYPDIYLKNKNLVIEVKSQYTYELDLQLNLAKRDAVILTGIGFEFWIFDNDKNLTIL